MNTSYVIIAYYIYIPIVIFLTWYVAHTLFTQSQVFMMDIFHGKEDIATSTRKLLEIGFYLINLGFAFIIMEIYSITTKQEMLEKLSVKIGGFSIYLGIMLFINMYLFFRGRRISKQRALEAKQYPGLVNE
jgi:hypothetical protein